MLEHHQFSHETKLSSILEWLLADFTDQAESEFVWTGADEIVDSSCMRTSTLYITSYEASRGSFTTAGFTARSAGARESNVGHSPVLGSTSLSLRDQLVKGRQNVF